MKKAFLPEGEHVRRAVRWISDNRNDDPSRSAVALVSEAATRFDLSPLEEDWLLRTFAGYETEAIPYRTIPPR
jgi:hypothetical protein